MGDLEWVSGPEQYVDTPTGEVLVSAVVTADGRHGLLLSKHVGSQTLNAIQFYDEPFDTAHMQRLAEPLLVKLEDRERALVHPEVDTN